MHDILLHSSRAHAVAQRKRLSYKPPLTSVTKAVNKAAALYKQVTKTQGSNDGQRA